MPEIVMPEQTGSENTERELGILRWQDKAKAREIGWMGIFLGAASEKPGNIAGFVVIASFILFAAVMIWGSEGSSISKKDALLIIAGFISLSLGFLFGHVTKGK
jgi:hypothetical protein